MRYYLLLSDPELKQTIERLETLCAIEVDVKDMNKPKKGKVKQLCRYLRERVRPDKVETLGASPANPESKADTVYVSTGKYAATFIAFICQNCATAGSAK